MNIPMHLLKEYALIHEIVLQEAKMEVRAQSFKLRPTDLNVSTSIFKS